MSRGSSYRAYISNEAHSAVPANLETDEMRIAVFPEGSTDPTVYLALRGREGLLTWHKENVGISLDRPVPMPIAKLLGLVTSNAIMADHDRPGIHFSVPKRGGRGPAWSAWCWSSHQRR